MSTAPFDVKNFRRALGQFPTGVTVITTLDASGNPVGVTASSFNSVSIEPALVLWSIDKGANSLSAFENAKHFAVNVLGSNQVATSNNFASRGQDKFANANYRTNVHGIPLLDDCAAQFECSTWAVYEGGDHLILVGQVQQYSHQSDTAPLVFSRGSYAVTAQHPMMTQPSVCDDDNAEDFVSDYLLYLLRETYQRFSDKLYPELNQVCDVTPQEWRILARMANRSQIAMSSLSEMVMQPMQSLRQTTDWMAGKGLVLYPDNETLAVTDEGAKIAKQLQELALSQETQLLDNLDSEQALTIKTVLKQLIEKLA
ncbi:MAG: putative nitrilotriacetate monooxygenase component B (NtaB) [Osedax symbiont Rs2]|nr:MAG: putative nitrilotriacetate monooxygenase component B (NtaB) [Osedax symbiont Rs2]